MILHAQRHPRVIASFGIFLALVLLGAGCRKKPAPVFNAPPAGSPSLSISSEDIRNAKAKVGATLGDIVSTNGEWHAYAVIASDKTLTMILEGKSYKKEFPITAPVSFSPDSRTLVFSSDGGYGTLGLYTLSLPPKQSARRVTNTIKIRNDVGGKSLIPVPVDTIVNWNDKKMRYSVPNEGTFELNLVTGKVQRVGA